VIQAVEGGHFLQGHIERVEEAYGRGLRHMGLLHDSDASVALGGERTNLTWQDQTEGFYYAVVDAMLRTGYKPDEIAKIGGGNFLRVFGEAVRK
jgi:membrane dipeptidase